MKYTYNDTLVSIKDVSLSFGDKLILKPTSIEVKDIHRPGHSQGQVIGILGPSGIGKTQLAKIIAGLQQPTSGTVDLLKVNEKANTKQLLPTVAGRVGVVFQNYRLFNWRTVLGNILVALEKSGLSKSQSKEKAMEYLKLFHLEDKSDNYPSQLSGGQRQRIAIIQSMMNNEHYLIMDEPFTGLDPLMKDKVCELITKVSTLHELNTIFVVAHDIYALVSVSDTLLLFGRERDPSGNIIPGATVKKTYNLIDLGLAWNPEISYTTRFNEFVTEVKNEFRNL